MIGWSSSPGSEPVVGGAASSSSSSHARVIYHHEPRLRVRRTPPLRSRRRPPCSDPPRVRQRASVAERVMVALSELPASPVSKAHGGGEEEELQHEPRPQKARGAECCTGKRQEEVNTTTSTATTGMERALAHVQRAVLHRPRAGGDVQHADDGGATAEGQGAEQGVQGLGGGGAAARRRWGGAGARDQAGG